MDEYIETGQSISDTYPLQGSNKNIQYILSNKKHITCTINLLVRKKLIYSSVNKSIKLPIYIYIVSVLLALL